MRTGQTHKQPDSAPDRAPDWTPEHCTLDQAGRQVRAAEFDTLFAANLGIGRPDPGRLRVDLRPDPQIAEKAARLAVAETDCCSFFTITLTAVAGRLALEIAAPPAQASVLDRLAARAGGQP